MSRMIMKLFDGNTTKKFASVILCLVAATEVSAQVFWTAVNNGLPTNSDIRALAIDSTNGDVFAGTFGGGVFRSTNNGSSWTSDTTGLRDRRVLALVINSSGHIFAGTFNGGVFRSTSNGTNWVEVTNLANSTVLALTINATNGHIWAGTEAGVYRSTNNGNNWQNITNDLGNRDVRTLAINTSGNIFAGTAAGVFRSTNNGNRWVPVNQGLTNPSIRTLAISKSGTIFAGTDAGIFRSVDNGNNWTPINAGLTTLGTNALAINANGIIFAGTFGGGVFRSTNNGDIWAAVNTGLTSLNLQALAITPSGFLFAGTADGGAFRTQVSTTAGPVLISIAPESGNRLQTLDVVFTGTNILGNSPSVIVGEGITVNSVTEGLLDLTANLTIGADAATGPREFRVKTEGILGGTSNPKIFTVNNPAPTTASISPTSKTVGDASFTMTVTGMNFVSSSTVRLNGADRATTFISSTQLNVTIPESDLTAAGTLDVTVFNPAPGGGTSNAQTFTVNNPAPTTTTISPSNRTVGDAGFTMTVNGTNFVPGSIVRFGGSNRSTTFVNSTELTATIPASDLTTAGAFEITVSNPAPGGGTSNAQTFTVSPVGNPFPALTNISPTSRIVGDAGFTMTVMGTNFVTGSVVRFNGSDRTTTFVDSTELTVIIPASDLTIAGMFNITVFNPPPGGGTSNAQTFTVVTAGNPAPTLTSIMPANKIVGDAGFAMTVIGTNFVKESVVRFNGSDRATTFVSSTELTATIPASDLTIAGMFNITVFNPAPGGGTSNTQTFTVSPVDNPVPTLTNISPASKTVGDAEFTMNITGTNFISSSKARFNGSERMTFVGSSTQLTATIPDSDLTTAGTFNITVFNPAPGGGTSTAQTFTVNNPVPATSSISPLSKTVGEAEFTMTVNGTNFVSTSVVRFNGAARTTTFVNSMQLTAIIPTSDLTTAGTFNITVFNPTPGGGTSEAQTFTVNPRTVTLTAIAPTSGNRLDTLDVVFTGTNFISAVSSVNVGAGITVNSTTVTSSTSLEANLTITALATTGKRDFSVTNSGPNSGTSESVAFTVNNPKPTLASIDPKSGGRSQMLEVVFTGTKFFNDASSVNVGQGITVTRITVDSPTSLRAILAIAPNAGPGARNFSVTNSGPGGGTSESQTFTITKNSAPVITHTPLSSQLRRVPIQVDAKIVDDSNALNATLHYRRGGEVDFNSVVMLSSNNDSLFQGTIPESEVISRGVEYYITATDGTLTTRLPVSGIFSIPIEIDNQYKQTAQPYGSAQNAYRLISVPFDLDDKSPGAVLEDDLGKYDDTKWRFSELLANQTYAEFPNTSPMAPGKAFWLIVTEAGKLIDIDNGISNRTDAKYAVALHPQWNFIGNPFNFTIPVRNLSLKSSGQSPDLYFYDGTWNDPANAPVEEMQPFEGYAVYSDALSGDTLFIDPDLSSGATSSHENYEPLWSIRILAQSRQARDANNVAAVAAAASRARDRMDHPEPPVVGEYVSVYFPHRDWATIGPGYCTDARPEFSRGEIWEFEVATNIRDKVNLTFEGIAQVPDEFEVWVMDEALQLSQNLRKRNQYAVAGADHPKQLKLVVGRAEFVTASLAEVKIIPTSYELSQNFPNPFNPATTIHYGLPKAERVTLQVYNLLGEEVVTLIDHESKEAGYHAAIWAGRNRHDQPVTSGIYFYRLRAGSFMMTKKMVLVQ